MHKAETISFKVLLLSYSLAVAIHAAVILAASHAMFSNATIGAGGDDSFEVGLVSEVPRGMGTGEEPPPPPPDETPPEQPEAMQQPQEAEIPLEPPAPDSMVLPDETAPEKPAEPSKEKPQMALPPGIEHSTQPMSPEEAERAHRFAAQFGRAGKGRPGMGTGFGAGSGGGGFGVVGGMRCISCPYPDYPIEARKLKMQGTVVLVVLIGADGKIESLVVKKSSGSVLLDQAAMRAIRKWQVEPMHVAGVPVSARAEQQITFNLVDAATGQPSE
jgi:protein TonB